MPSTSSHPFEPPAAHPAATSTIPTPTPASTPIGGVATAHARVVPPPPSGAVPPPPPPGAPLGAGGFGGPSPMVPMPTPTPKGGRSIGTIVAVALAFAVPLTGIGWGVYAWTQAEDEAEEVRDEVIEAIDDITIPDISIPDISIPEISVPVASVPDISIPEISVPVASVPDISIPEISVPELTLPVAPVPTDVTDSVPVSPPAPVSLFDGTQASDVIAAFEATISGEPSRFAEIVLYPTYAFATAQDASIPQNLDEFPWRDGVVGASSPVMIVGDGDLEPTLFAASEVDWAQIPRLVAESPALTTVAQPEVTHVIVSRSEFIDGMPLTLRVYVSDARSSAYVEWSAAGEVLKVV